MRSFVKQKRFTGALEEDIDSRISIYEIMAVICEVSGDENLEALAVMLIGSAFLYYYSHVKHCGSFENAINAL